MDESDDREHKREAREREYRKRENMHAIVEALAGAAFAKYSAATGSNEVRSLGEKLSLALLKRAADLLEGG